MFQTYVIRTGIKWKSVSWILIFKNLDFTRTNNIGIYSTLEPVWIYFTGLLKFTTTKFYFIEIKFDLIKFDLPYNINFSMITIFLYPCEWWYRWLHPWCYFFGIHDTNFFVSVILISRIHYINFFLSIVQNFSYPWYHFFVSMIPVSYTHLTLPTNREV